MTFQFTVLKKHENQAPLLSALYPAFVQDALQKWKFNFCYPMGLGLSPKYKNRAFRQSAGTLCFSGVGTHRICLLFCKKIPVNLCWAADLPGMWEYVHSCDPLLERQESRGICVPWIPPEWKILLFLPPYS